MTRMVGVRRAGQRPDVIGGMTAVAGGFVTFFPPLEWWAKIVMLASFVFLTVALIRANIHQEEQNKLESEERYRKVIAALGALDSMRSRTRFLAAELLQFIAETTEMPLEIKWSEIKPDSLRVLPISDQEDMSRLQKEYDRRFSACVTAMVDALNARAVALDLYHDLRSLAATGSVTSLRGGALDLVHLAETLPDGG